ncbi:hypothetical protein RV10_GL004289 [Enterococcus pallens]|nr:hypothetical protein RV10_GL004289 [Enterococcus pallens]
MLSRKGAFTLDNEGNPLTEPPQSVDPLSNVDEDWDECVD